MNSDTVQTLVRSILKIAAGMAIAKGWTDDSTATEIAGGIAAFVGVIWGVLHRTPSLEQPARRVSTLLLVGGAGVFLTGGCSIAAIKQGDVVMIKERIVGIRVVSTSTQTQTPEVDFGLSSTVMAFIPTSTNALHIPRVMDTFDLHNTAVPFDVGISENLGTGDVLVGAGTNGTSRALWGDVPGPSTNTPAR